MWYDTCVPAELHRNLIDDAEAAIAFAQQVRAYHRRRTATDSERRLYDIALARERLRDAMKPLRSEIGRFHFGPQTTIAERNRDVIRDVSQRIGAERRKLTKMDRNPK